MMPGNSLLLWYCVLPLIASSLNFRSNSTSDNKKEDSSTAQYQLNVNTTKNYEGDLIWHNEYENSTKNSRDMQYGTNSTNNNDEDDDLMQDTFRAYDGENHKNDSQTFVESRTNLKDTNDNFVSYEISKNLKRTEDKEDFFTSIDFLETVDRDNNESNSIPYKICDNITCIQLCCPLNCQMINGKCVATDLKTVSMEKLYVYINDSLQVKSKRADTPLLLVVNDPCRERGKYLINFSLNPILLSIFLENGVLNLPYYMTNIEPTSYCLAVNENEIGIYVCLDTIQKIFSGIKIIFVKDPIEISTRLIILVGGHIIVLLFTLLMFIAYSVVPEFRNIHGYILRIYSILTFIPYVIELMKIPLDTETIGTIVCAASAIIRYYCFLASFCWLNIMSFNMWRTFRQFRVAQRNEKQEERKKLIMYSVYGWGVPFIFATICSIMEFVPGTPYQIRPGLINDFCWFSNNKAFWLYYYGIVILFLLVSIFLSIFTARNIAKLEKDISHQLKDAESRRYNDNKHWFKLTVRVTKVLFIIICLKSYIYIVSTLYKEAATSIWCTFILLEVIQHVCIFIIFVWKKNIKDELIKRFNCQNCCKFSKTYNAVATTNNCTPARKIYFWKKN